MTQSDVAPTLVSAGLTSLDYSFAYYDSDATPQNICNVYVLDNTRTAGVLLTQAELEEHVRSRLTELPEFTVRLRRFLLEVDSPRWESVPSVDLGAHVTVSTLHGEGPAVLSRWLAETATRRLDLSKPPWQVSLAHGVRAVPGLPHDASVLVVTVHHSMCDGIGTTEIGRVLLGGPALDRSVGWASSMRPTPRWSVIEAVARQLGDFRKARGIMKQLECEAREAIESGEIAPPKPTRPRTRFNKRVGVGRTLGSVLFSLEELNSVRRDHCDVTVNDVMLGVVSGALRSYLSDRGELTGESLCCAVPKSVRELRECASANKTTSMAVDLHTDIADATERMREIHESVRSEKRKKEHPAALGRFDCAGIAPALVSRVGGILARHARHAGPTVPWVNVTVSNYMRESTGLSLGNASVVSGMCLPMLQHGMGLVHMIASVGDALTLTFVADIDALPNPAVYAQRLKEAYGELGGRCEVLLP